MAAFIKNEDNEEEIMAEINMTPLIDIMLVLLIIFMVTSSVSFETGIEVNLPSGGQGLAQKTKDNPIIVSISSNNQVSIQGRKTKWEEFPQKLKSELDLSSNKIVILEGDKLIPLGEAIKIIDLAKKQGATEVALATENK